MVYRLVCGVQAGVWAHIMHTPAHTNLQSRSSLPPCSLCRCQVGTPNEQYMGPFLGEGKMAPTCRMLSAHYPAMDPLRKNLGMTCSKFMRDMFLQVFQFF